MFLVGEQRGSTVNDHVDVGARTGFGLRDINQKTGVESEDIRTSRTRRSVSMFNCPYILDADMKCSPPTERRLLARVRRASYGYMERGSFSTIFRSSRVDSLMPVSKRNDLDKPSLARGMDKCNRNAPFRVHYFWLSAKQRGCPACRIPLHPYL